MEVLKETGGQQAEALPCYCKRTDKWMMFVTLKAMMQSRHLALCAPNTQKILSYPHPIVTTFMIVLKICYR